MNKDFVLLILNDDGSVEWVRCFSDPAIAARAVRARRRNGATGGHHFIRNEGAPPRGIVWREILNGF